MWSTRGVRGRGKATHRRTERVQLHSQISAQKTQARERKESTHLKPLHILDLGEFVPIRDAGLKEAGSHRDADGLRRHARVRRLRRVGNGSKCSKKKDKQMLRDVG